MATLPHWLLQTGFGRPRGPLGWLGGRIMARGNATVEHHLVEIADPHEHEAVLVIGPGPGIGLQLAAERSADVTGLDPSAVMLAACRGRCSHLIEQKRLRLVQGVAEHTTLPENSIDLVITVNNISIWSDRQAGLRELHRILRPGGRLLISMHAKFLPDAPAELAEAVREGGFTDIDTWSWQPPGRNAIPAQQLRARRPQS
jgi:ubiquinone/menaquinone biosynthesis C-methylase UbiE